ncbi:ParB-like nuclease domain protein [Gordonia phage Nyceirae]|uniref:ParB-like nuclease domain protein n=1 Tax=Gordonia phage Nyceirae TaxID=1887651 RepID=A0A1C9EHY8_9CAUD|nr:ParB-like partition protein [Gordonia phage Nyceirae]AON97409.1 ParB-like nuclease domain protein [Gordonia phage Nyceirae]
MTDMPSNSTATEPTTELAQLKPSQLVAHPKNIRRDVGDITSLADSIAAQGIRHPLVVAPNGKPDKYILIAGHRRLAAAKKLRLKTVPCIVDTAITDEADQIAAMLAENIERQDLTAVEESDGVALLLDLGLNQKQIASRTGMTSPRVRNRVKVAKLSDDMKTRLTEHEVTLADAVFIADHADHPGDLAELENALGTNNWAVARQQQLDRDAERKRVAAVRKAAEAAGIEVVTGWDARRDLNSSAPEKLGTTHHEMERESFEWPAKQDILERAQSADTVAYLHIAEGSRSLWVGTKMVSEELVILSAPAPAPATPDGATDTPTSPGRSDTAQDTEPDSRGGGVTSDEPAYREPTDEERAAEERRDALKAAATVRTEWVRTLIATGDDAAATKATALAAAHSLWGFNEWGFSDAWPFIDGGAVAEGELESTARAWFSTPRKPASVLLAILWTSVFHTPAEALVDGWLTHLDLEDLRFLVAYGELLADLGYVLSDVETAVLDQARAEIAAEEASDED